MAVLCILVLVRFSFGISVIESHAKRVDVARCKIYKELNRNVVKAVIKILEEYIFMMYKNCYLN